jgi:aspartate/methionine/tyrosine aminotransferase
MAGIYAAVMGLVDEGEEVVMIEPFFDIYNGALAMALANPKYVPLRPSTVGVTLTLTPAHTPSDTLTQILIHKCSCALRERGREEERREVEEKRGRE